ncbi:hypothetical protein LINPERHAP1_LOCUS39994, partial [Linum perenne]
VWVRLPGIPLKYSDVAVLTTIGNRIGRRFALITPLFKDTEVVMHVYVLRLICQSRCCPNNI